MSTTASTVTWAALTAQEPALLDLEAEVRQIRHSRAARSRHFCANGAWYGYGGWPGIKPRLVRLVGWYAGTPEVRSRAAYDLAYRHLYNLLPDCRECGCMRRGEDAEE